MLLIPILLTRCQFCNDKFSHSTKLLYHILHLHKVTIVFIHSVFLEPKVLRSNTKVGGWGSPVPPPTNTKYKMYEPCWWAIVLPSINICRWTSARTMPHSPCLSFTTLGINVIYWHTRKHSPSINHAGITDMEIRVLCSKTNVLSHGDKGTAGSGQIQFWCWNRFWAGL